MSQWSQASLTPSRPAPAPPGARGSPSSLPPSRSNGRLPTVAATPIYTSKSYANSFPTMQSSNKGSSDVASAIIRMGAANMKEEGLRSFLWSKRWLVLTVSELQIFKNEVSRPVDFD